MMVSKLENILAKAQRSADLNREAYIAPEDVRLLVEVLTPLLDILKILKRE